MDGDETIRLVHFISHIHFVAINDSLLIAFNSLRHQIQETSRSIWLEPSLLIEQNL
jgi:hypothetical protein